MKVKIKGLVFVGFAAAILSANAMATDGDQNIVTSKAYTDATYQAKSTVNGVGTSGGSWKVLDSTIPSGNETANNDTAPTTAAVKSYVDSVATTAGNAQVKSTADFQVGALNGGWKQIVPGTNVALAVDGTDNTKVNLTVDQSGKQDKTTASSGYKVGNSNGTWADMGSAVTAANNGYISVTGGTSGAAVALDVDANKINNTATLPANATNANDKLITEYALSQALAAQSTANAGDYQPKTGSGDDYKIGMENGSWATVAGDGNVTVSTNLSKDTVTVGVSTISGFTNVGGSNAGVDDVDNAKLPSALAIKTYVDNQDSLDEKVANKKTDLTVSGNVSDTYYPTTQAVKTYADTKQAKSSGLSVGNTGGTWLAADTTVSSSGTSVPTTAAVATAIENATGGNAIPAKDPEICTATYPCALVAEGSLLNWRVMAVSSSQSGTHAAGYCGNLGDADCDGVQDS